MYRVHGPFDFPSTERSKALTVNVHQEKQYISEHIAFTFHVYECVCVCRAKFVDLEKREKEKLREGNIASKKYYLPCLVITYRCQWSVATNDTQFVHLKLGKRQRYNIVHKLGKVVER